VELARPLDHLPDEQPSALASLRLHRELAVEEAAKRAALSPHQVEWLDEGRLDRFPNSQAAVLALLRYATSLGVDHREARRLSGLPVEPAPPRRLGRWLALLAAAVLAGTLATALVVALGGSDSTAARPPAILPPPEHVPVDVLNGGGDSDFTRQLAGRIGSLGYRVEHVTKAGRLGYRRTAVYFKPGGQALAHRLASQLGCGTVSPLPGGNNPRRLVVIAGSAEC
jgi:LytR cell envelope-related transcriptional attenuator/Helix-turn-helix domain